MKTQDVANQWAQMCREGKNMECIEALYGDSVVSKEMPGMPGEVISGKQNVWNKSKEWLDNVQEFQNYLQTLIFEYEKCFKYMNDIKIFSSPTPIMIDTPWINIQKKYEFIPNHTHDGVYSYALWVKIPYDIKEEFNNDHCHASTFEFTYNNVTGSINNLKIPISKEYEGKIIFFPAKLQHCVYPFYTSDENRISISGNIVFKT